MSQGIRAESSCPRARLRTYTTCTCPPPQKGSLNIWPTAPIKETTTGMTPAPEKGAPPQCRLAERLAAAAPPPESPLVSSSAAAARRRRQRRRRRGRATARPRAWGCGGRAAGRGCGGLAPPTSGRAADADVAAVMAPWARTRRRPQDTGHLRGRRPRRRATSSPPFAQHPSLPIAPTCSSCGSLASRPTAEYAVVNAAA